MVHDLQRYLVEEFAEEYQEGRMSRRDMLRRVLLMTGSVAITASALSGLGVHSKNAEAAAPPRSVRPERPVSNVPLGPLRPNENGTAPPPAQTSDNVVDPNDPAIVAGRVSFGGARRGIAPSRGSPHISDEPFQSLASQRCPCTMVGCAIE